MAEEKKNENDLNNLLDDALNDFDTPASNVAGVKGSQGESGDVPASNASANPDSNEFFIEQAKVLAERMNTLFGGPDTPSGDIPPLPQDPDKIISGFKKMAEAAAATLQGENPSNDEEVAKFSDSIAFALKGMQEGTETLTAPVSENDIASMFGNLILEGGDDGEGNMFLPFMEGLMQSLLSAEIVLPSIKVLIEKYPQYLEANAETLSTEDKERYEKQLELYKVIEGHLESESPDDSATVKREKFRIVLDDMRKLQEYGQPPAEILSETVGCLPLIDPTSGEAGAANADPQCPTM